MKSITHQQIVSADLSGATDVINELIHLHGLDFVLRVCASAAIEREADYRAAREFMGKGGR